MNKQQIIEATKNTMLLSATIHIILLLVRVVQTADFTLLNVFNILDIDLFFPQITFGITNFVLSQVVIITIFLFFFHRVRKLQ